MRHRGHLRDDALPEWLLEEQTDLHAEVITTHISWLLLIPDWVFKVKQPVKFPFWTTPRNF